MLTAIPPLSLQQRALSAMKLSLLVLMLLFLSAMAQQKSVAPFSAERGFVGQLEQLVVAAHSGSLKLQKDSSSRSGAPEPGPSLHWATTSNFDLVLARFDNASTRNSRQRDSSPLTPAYLLPPLRAPPVA
tara:strand:+ start:589 stop:978 length:390 start_codon:yes stop_codon:yes gene_type:complete